MQTPTRVFIVDKNEQGRQEITRLLHESSDVDVVGQASGIEDTLHSIVETAPDIVIRDLTETGLNGLHLVQRIRRALPSCRVLVLTLDHDEACIVPIVQAGVSGSVARDCISTRLIPAVDALSRGEVYFGQLATRTLAENLAKN